ncbi:MAG: hypothetical protein GTO60_11190 [Gammaproteobacteria bacterium]|nr:hypothetical protein [Gammaproteobacteria bacterium]
MRCTDCHGSDAADGGVSIPEGPHGSGTAKILKIPAGSPYTQWSSSVNWKNNSSTIWCFNCHSNNFTNTGFTGSNPNFHLNKHDDSNCQTCHIAVPHGTGNEGSGSANQRKRLLKTSNWDEGIDSMNPGSADYNENDGHAVVNCGT